MNKILIIIPCYNEEKNISKTIQSIKRLDTLNQFEILCINDCSKDDTIEVIKCEEIKYLDLSCNLGIGGAVQAGYIYARDKGFNYAVQIDGDGQHNPQYILDLKKSIDEGYSLAIGSRFIKKEGFQSSFMRRVGINFFYYLIKFLTRIKITDATSGFRMCDRKLIEKFAESYPIDYPEPETIVQVIKSGLKVKEVPVIMNERKHGESSINFLSSLYYMVKVGLAIIISSIGRSGNNN